jgi:hypothetical protein
LTVSNHLQAGAFDVARQLARAVAESDPALAAAAWQMLVEIAQARHDERDINEALNGLACCTDVPVLPVTPGRTAN